MKMKYSKDGRVSFDKETHSYLLGEKRLTGVTSFISKYKQPFDSVLIATKYAKKHGLNVDEVLAKWKQEGETSTKNGTSCHDLIEHFVLTGEIKPNGISDKEKVAVKIIEELFLTKRLTPVEVELIVYNDVLASQIDCIAKNEKGEHFILDWKTNKKIDTFAYNKFMLPPFDHLPDCNFYHYSLQLSLYKQMCKEYDIKDCFIIHLDNEDYNIIPIEFIPVEF
jgi:ATP-dependent exoDNAse (exonuclease V) beta subunit